MVKIKFGIIRVILKSLTVILLQPNAVADLRLDSLPEGENAIYWKNRNPIHSSKYCINVKFTELITVMWSFKRIFLHLEEYTLNYL